MTSKRAIQELKALQSSADTEAAHCDVVDEYHKVEKWYA